MKMELSVEGNPLMMMMMALVCRISVLQVAKKVPNLKIEYAVDSRQQIADSWPMVRSCCC